MCFLLTGRTVPAFFSRILHIPSYDHYVVQYRSPQYFIWGFAHGYFVIHLFTHALFTQIYKYEKEKTGKKRGKQQVDEEKTRKWQSKNGYVKGDVRKDGHKTRTIHHFKHNRMCRKISNYIPPGKSECEIQAQTTVLSHHEEGVDNLAINWRHRVPWSICQNPRNWRMR